MTPAEEIRDRHKGAVRQSDWKHVQIIKHRGEYIRRYKSRPVPEDCRWFHPCEIEKIPEPARTKARQILKKHPRTRGIIAYMYPKPMPTYKPTN